jgi:hypothetical protein
LADDWDSFAAENDLAEPQYVARNDPVWLADWLAVHLRPVAALQVGEVVATGLPRDLGVEARDRAILNDDGGRWIATNPGSLLYQLPAPASERASLADKRQWRIQWM